jgi:GWxTD domain-containing protein
MNSLPCILRRPFLVAFALSLLVARVTVAQRSRSGPNEDERSVQPVHTFGKPVFLFQTYVFASEDPRQARIYLYLGFVNDILQFVKEDDGRFCARYEVSADLLDQDRNLIDGKTWRGDLVATDFKETNSRSILNLTSAQFDIPPGKRRLRFEFIDLDTRRQLQREKEIDIPDFSDRSVLRMSDVVFADSVIFTSGDRVRFVPNLGRNRDEPESAFQAFFEIYPAARRDSVQAAYQILNWRREVIDTFVHEYAGGKAPIREILEIGEKIDKPGRYYLDIVVRQGKQRVSRSESFYIARVGDDEPFRFSPQVVSFEPLRYVLSEKEYQRMKNAPEAERRRMVEEFWQARDPDPSTEINELEVEFYRRVHFANQNFSVTSMDKEGWQTDRGRIYIVFGQPTEVRQHRLDLNKPPLEVWYYLRDNRRFIFRDKQGTGDYKLIHER